MSVDFNSSKYTIERAKHHLMEFERQSAEFFKTKPFAEFIEIDSGSSERVHKVKLIKPLPIALPGIAFDLVNNLRSALDQAVNAITRAIGVKDTYFPFSDSAANFHNTVKGRCNTLPPDIQSLISGFKPYKGGNNLLWALNALCNTNKHSFIAPVAVDTGDGIFAQIVTNSEGGRCDFKRAIWDRAKNEMELFRQPLQSKDDAHFHVTCHITICDVIFIDGNSAITVFNEFIRIVEVIIMALEAECIRLNL